MSAGDFQGRHAIVTGAGSGIGAAIAGAVLGAGGSVLALDLDEGGLDALSRRHPGQVTGVVADVSDEPGVVRAVARAVDTAPIDHLFNVAGVGSTTSAPDTPVEMWDRVLSVNARGTFLTCKHVIPHMAARGAGTIVNIASIAGLVGLRNRAAYCASKGAVIALTRAMAVDHVRDGVRVNCVCPGTVDSPWVRRLVEELGESLDALRARQPVGRLGTPDEIADAALYLASDRAAFATGTVLTIDGGLTAA